MYLVDTLQFWKREKNAVVIIIIINNFYFYLKKLLFLLKLTFLFTENRSRTEKWANVKT